MYVKVPADGPIYNIVLQKIEVKLAKLLYMRHVQTKVLQKYVEQLLLKLGMSSRPCISLVGLRMRKDIYSITLQHIDQIIVSA